MDDKGGFCGPADVMDRILRCVTADKERKALRAGGMSVAREYLARCNRCWHSDVPTAR